MSENSIFNINIFTPKPGLGEALVQAQLDGLPRLGDFPGWSGGRLFRAEDGDRLILVSAFDGVEAHRRFMASDPFLAHRERLRPLIDSSEAAYYRQIYARG